MSAGPVARQDGSYRKGIVLGLTMAEIMLLLMFCFLVALGSVVKRERDERVAAQERLAAAEASAGGNAALSQSLKENPRLAEALAAAAGQAGSPAQPAEIDRFWRRLVEGNAVAEALDKAGLPRERAVREASRLVDAAKALDASAATAPDAALAAKAREAFPEQAKAGDAAVADALAKASQPQPKESGGGILGFLTGRGRHSWPPIISLSEADGFHFASGRADLDLGSADRLAKSIVPRILEIAKSYDVDTIEVVGHTDEQPVSARGSSLDRGLPAVLRGTASAAGLAPADNAGLGLARAVSVVTRLTVDKRLERFAILPLSGGQLITNDQRLSVEGGGGDVQQRRRIEIRMRQSHPPSR